MAQELVADALRTARFNEIVHLCIENENETEKEKQQQQQEISLVPSLDEANGGIEWKQVLHHNNCDDDDNQEYILRRHLQTKQWMFPMLNDHCRNQIFQLALERACKKLLRVKKQDKDHKEEDEEEEQQQALPAPALISVLDIGTGTGLLSMMVANNLSTFSNNSNTNVNVNVHSIEMSTAMAQLARTTIQSNQHLFSENTTIAVSTGHSTSFQIQPHQEQQQKFDICVSELLESGLLGEGILPTLRDAQKRLLRNKDDGDDNDNDDAVPIAIMIPQAARVYAVPVQADFIRNLVAEKQEEKETKKNPHPTENDSTDHLVDSLRLCVDDAAAADDQSISCSLFSLLDSNNVLPVHADKLLRESQLTMLAEPIQILEIDFQNIAEPVIQENDDDNHNRTTVTVTATQHGTVHAILVWWELDLWSDDDDDDDEHGELSDKTTRKLTYSMRPGAESWQDHWHQCLHLLPSAFGKEQQVCASDDSAVVVVEPGESLTLQAWHNDTRIFVALQKRPEGESACKRPRQKLISSSSSPSCALISPQRALQLLDRDRTCFFAAAINSAVAKKGILARVLDLSDFCLCASLAALAGCKHVTCLESSSSSENLPLLSAKVAQIGNGLPLDKDAHFEILECYAEQLTVDLLGDAAVDIVVAEPYYLFLEGWHLQEALNFYYLVRSLRTRDLIAPDACVIPSGCRIMGCAIESKQLRSAYSGCGDERGNVCGFDHSAVNLNGDRFDEFDLSLPLWQYDYERLTGDWELARLDFQHPVQGPIRSTTQTTFCRTGSFDAIIIWLEYTSSCIGDRAKTHSNSIQQTLSTDRCSYRQCVRMMRKPVPIVLSAVVDSPQNNTHNSPPPPRVQVITMLGGLNNGDSNNNVMDHQFVVTVLEE